MFSSDEDVERSLAGFGGLSMTSVWTPLGVRFSREAPYGSGAPASDFPHLEGISVFSARAVDALADLLAGRCELLPLDCDEGEYYALNVTRLVDALDEERSELVYFSSGRLMGVDRFAFRPDKLVGETIFKLRQKPRWHEFVTGVFRGRVESAGLTGFAFDWRVWEAPRADDPRDRERPRP